MKRVKILALLMFAMALQMSCVSQGTKNQTDVRHPSESSSKLTIEVGDQVRQFSREDLLKSPLAKKIVVEKDPAYPGRRMVYNGVPIASLFEGLPVDRSGTMLFSCLDGFSAPISTGRLLNRGAKGSIAYIAIETSDEKWPALKAENPTKTAGPFYLVWENPEKSKIVTEEWPYQLAGFELKPSLEAQFPDTVPDLGLAEQSPIRKGYKAFMQNCFACHTLNGDGTSQMGPDLNVPHNPTEYLKLNYLIKLVRNPQNLRHWPQSKMTGFDRTTLSDADLQNIILYLQHMSSRKIQ